jgi:hypothetical protein
MPIYTLTIIDTTGVQDYIFGSNRLRENVGASQLVEMVTHEFLEQSLNNARLEGATLTHNHTAEAEGKHIEDSLDVEVILQGGGNAVLLSRNEDVAKAVVRQLSRLLLRRAPGLEIAVAHHSFDWDTQSLGGEVGEYEKLLGKLNQAKQQRHPSTPVLGQGVTLECRSTGLPAVGYGPAIGGDPAEPLSADILAKVNEDVVRAAKQRLTEMFQDVTAGYDFSSDFDELGGTRDESRYIAVVHADGNGIGQRFQQVIEEYRQPGAGNRACLTALQELSKAVADAGKCALRETVKQLVETFKHPGKGNPRLPLRPIVFGGDDVTFVCDGRLGLPLAAIYLREWEQASRSLPHGGQAYACAGVAVVKTHYPFARAYNLADDLCRNAKKALKKENVQASALDWHFAFSGIFGAVKQIRECEYQVQAGDLTMRPVKLSQAATDGMQPAFNPHWRTWPKFKQLVGVFAGDLKVNKQGKLDSQGEVYANRNKVKGLREALRGGGNVVEHFRSAYALDPLPELDVSNTTLQYTGWADGHCGYFDAIEALDFFLPLEPWVTQ